MHTSLCQIVFSGSCDQPSSSAHQYKVFIKATEDTKKNKKSDGWGTLTQESSKRECKNLLIIKILVVSEYLTVSFTDRFTNCFTDFRPHTKLLVLQSWVRYVGPG